MKTAAILECNEQKTTDLGFEFFIDVSLYSDNGVFRRYHVTNKPKALHSQNPLLSAEEK